MLGRGGDLLVALLSGTIDKVGHFTPKSVSLKSKLVFSKSKVSCSGIIVMKFNNLAFEKNFLAITKGCGRPYASQLWR